MGKTINIQKVKFEFAMENEESAFDLYSGWDSFYHSLFVKVVEKVLSAYDQNEVHLYIETLELNLGEIPRDEFYEKFPVLLEEKLEELMQKLSIQENSEEMKKTAKHVLFFETFTYYLIHGFYPWPGNNTSDDFKTLFPKIIKEYPNEFRDFLFLYGHYTSLRRRLVLQLEDEDLEELVLLINHAESPFIISYFRLLIDEKTLRETGTDRAKEHRDACWEVILAYLLTLRGSYFNRKEFVNQTIAELAAHYNISYTDLLRFLTTTAEDFLRESYFHSELKRILLALNNESPEREKNEDDKQARWFEKLKECLIQNRLPSDFDLEEFARWLTNEPFRQKLLATFTFDQLAQLTGLISEESHAGAQTSEALFSELLETSIRKGAQLQAAFIEGVQKEYITPAIYLDEIKRELRQPLFRRVLISKLNETAIHQLVKILAPAESIFIIEYARSLDEQKEKNLFEGKAGGEFQQLKWEFIFAVMVEDADMSFNRKSFVLSVITMLASHYNLRTVDLLSYIYRATLDGKIHLKAELTGILKDLYFETKAERPKLQEVNWFDKVTKEAFYASLLKDFIQTGVAVNKPFADKLFDVLGYLEAYRPDLLLTVIESLKDGFVLTDTTSIVHHKEFYRRLIRFTVESYQISLPGGKQVQNLFRNIDEDRFQGVPVTTFKTLLLALLRNDTALYEKAWEVLTEKISPASLYHFNNLTIIPDEVLLRIIALSDKEEVQWLIASEPKPFIERVFSSTSLLSAVTECYRIHPAIAPALEKALQNISLVYLFEKLYRLYPSQGELLKIFFRLLATVRLKRDGTGYGRVVFEILTSLVSNSDNFPETLIHYLLKNGTNNHPDETTEALLAQTVKFAATGSSLEKNIGELIWGKKNKEESSLPENEEEQQTPTDAATLSLVEKAFSSAESLAAAIEYDRQNPAAIAFEKALQHVAPTYLIEKLCRLFPAEEKALKIFFGLLVPLHPDEEGSRYGHFIFEMLTALVKGQPTFFETAIGKLLKSGLTASEQNIAIAYLAQTARELPAGSPLKKSIETMISLREYPEDTEEIHTEEKNLIGWMVMHLGDGNETSEIIRSSVSLSNPVLFPAFEKLITEQPELIGQLISTGKISKHKATGWIKSAPLSLQLRWLQTITPPYQRMVIDEAFILIGWLQTALAMVPGTSLPWNKVTALLLDFSSGRLQYIDRDELFSRILSLCLKGVEPGEKDKITISIRSKAINHGQLWEKRIETILHKMNTKEETPAGAPSGKPVESPRNKADEEPRTLEEIYINNAGLVLCSPFLPQLFTMLGLMQEGAFIDRSSNERAVLLLQYLIYHHTIFPEHQMILNKLLCGLVTGTPIDCHIEVTEKEKTTMEQMLTGIIGHWNRLGQTSVEGLTETFLRREGKLEQKEDAWHLTVEQKSFDMLLDGLPWSYTPIKHPWMTKAIHVKWR